MRPFVFFILMFVDGVKLFVFIHLSLINSAHETHYENNQARGIFYSLFITAKRSNPSFATVFYSKNEALELAFGKDTQVEQLSLFPDEQQAAKIEELSKVKLDTGLFTFYVGKSQGKIIGYAAIESVTVRTKPETLLIVLTADGELRNVTTSLSMNRRNTSRRNAGLSSCINAR